MEMCVILWRSSQSATGRSVQVDVVDESKGALVEIDEIRLVEDFPGREQGRLSRLLRLVIIALSDLEPDQNVIAIQKPRRVSASPDVANFLQVEPVELIIRDTLQRIGSEAK